MTKTKVQIDRQAVLEAKKLAHTNDASQPALSAAERTELSELQAIEA